MDACLLCTTLCAAIGDIGRRVENGDFSLVFMNPEALVSSCRSKELFRTPMYQANLVAVVVDEAHCIEKW